MQHRGKSRLDHVRLPTRCQHYFMSVRNDATGYWNTHNYMHNDMYGVHNTMQNDMQNDGDMGRAVSATGAIQQTG